MRKSKSSSTSKRRTSSGRSGARTNTTNDRDERDDRDLREDEGRYGALGARLGSRASRNDYERMEYGNYGRGDYNREGLRTVSGRYSDFEDNGRSSRDRQPDRDSERGFPRAGRSREYPSVHDQDFYEGDAERSPWRDTYSGERNYPSRGTARSQNYRGQGRGFTEFDYDDDRVNSRNRRFESHHGYNDDYDMAREARYGSYRDRDERWMNNYDNRNDDVDSEYGYRERYNENRY